MLGLIISAVVLTLYILWCRRAIFTKKTKTTRDIVILTSKLAIVSFVAVAIVGLSMDLFYFRSFDQESIQKASKSAMPILADESSEEVYTPPPKTENISLELTILEPEKIKTRFKDVAGLEESKAEIREVVDFLKKPEKYKKLGATIPKGILLYGPPGTGKTLMARAVAGESGVTFIAVDGAAFDEMYVGVGASRVRELFTMARKLQPCIVFIDELDALAPSRGETGAVMSGRIQTVNQLLSEMDNVQENKNLGVVIMAATNRLESLDSALLRPGRFDRTVYIRIPNYSERIDIFKVHLKNVPVSKDINLESLAGTTYGFSGADIQNLVNEAALHAVKFDKNSVDKQDFNYAIDKIKLGLEVKSAIVSEEEKLLTAYHEAGHTIVGIFAPNFDYKFNKVTIGVRDETLGVTHFETTDDNFSFSKAFLEDELAMLLGGRLAERMLVGEDNVTAGAGNDLAVATGLAEKMVLLWGMSDLGDNISYGTLKNYPVESVNEEVRNILDQAKLKASSILTKHEDKLKALAQALVKKEILDHDEVMDILGIKQQGKPNKSKF